MGANPWEGGTGVLSKFYGYHDLGGGGRRKRPPTISYTSHAISETNLPYFNLFRKLRSTLANSIRRRKKKAGYRRVKHIMGVFITALLLFSRTCPTRAFCFLFLNHMHLFKVQRQHPPSPLHTWRSKSQHHETITTFLFSIPHHELALGGEVIPPQHFPPLRLIPLGFLHSG